MILFFPPVASPRRVAFAAPPMPRPAEPSPPAGGSGPSLVVVSKRLSTPSERHAVRVRRLGRLIERLARLSGGNDIGEVARRALSDCKEALQGIHAELQTDAHVVEDLEDALVQIRRSLAVFTSEGNDSR
jgi:hypothetical protein